MAIASKLRNEVTEWGILTMVLVVISVILLKFKTSNVGNAVCANYYNSTLDACCTASTTCNAGNQSAILSTGSFIDTVVAALSEPKNWIAIVIIGVIGFGLVKMFSKKD